MNRIESKQSKSRTRRTLWPERLETRRLMVAEGAPITLSQSVNTAGLTGDISAEIRLGDGRVEPISLSGGELTGNLNIRFDFSRDLVNFFDQPGATEALNFVAETFQRRLGDQLTAITTNPFVTVTPNIFDPATGQLLTLPSNPTLAANEIVVFAGGRNFAGTQTAEGGPGGLGFVGLPITAPTQDEVDALVQEAQDFIDQTRSRGQSGANDSTPTDFGLSFGSLAFDSSDRDWYFGLDPNGIGPGQTDFISVAAHELGHVFGFGTAASFLALELNNEFTGPASVAAYVGDGNVPLDVPTAFAHWSPEVATLQGTILDPTIGENGRELLSVLDLAALQDLGWEVLGLDASISGEFRFADDGVNAVEVLLSDRSGVELVFPVQTVTVTNVSPTLVSVGNQTAQVGQALSITNIGNITDPGFLSPFATGAQGSQGNQGDPGETFTFSIDWGDGVVDTGVATLDANGDFSGALTNASFDGVHTYQTSGVQTVSITVQDDDGGTTQASFQVNVLGSAGLTLMLSSNTITESDGVGAATLTISRGGDTTNAQAVALSSSDDSEATVPTLVVIPAGSASFAVNVTAVDDSLLDGLQTVSLGASGTGVEAATITLLVADQESISGVFSLASIVEGSAGTTLTVSRSNTDVATATVVTLVGGDTSQVTLPGQVTIPAGQQSVQLPVGTVDDGLPEPNETLTFTLNATGFDSGSADLSVVDDEPPLFQNQTTSADVDTLDGVTPLDALLIINAIVARGGDNFLDPTLESPGTTFVDVNGDYFVTPLDALLVINFLIDPTTTIASVALPLEDSNDDLHSREGLVDQAIGLLF